MKNIVFEHDSLLRRSRALRIASKVISEGIRSGSFRSMCKGRGIEFSGVREYLRGDDIRSIDWNVTARMGKAFVKQFEEDRELVVFLVIDASRSMYGGGLGKTKLITAFETAVLTAFAAADTNSPVGCAVFGSDIIFSLEPGREQVQLMVAKFDNILASSVSKDVTGSGSSLDKALKAATRILKKRSLVMVISDFRTTGYEKPLSLLCSKHDVLAVKITDSLDAELPEMGTVPFMDLESGYIQRFPTSSAAFRRSWREDSRQRTERWKNLCLRRGAAAIEISTEEDPVFKLQQFFSAKVGR